MTKSGLAQTGLKMMNVQKSSGGSMPDQTNRVTRKIRKTARGPSAPQSNAVIPHHLPDLSDSCSIRIVSGGIPVGLPHREQKATSSGNSVAQCVHVVADSPGSRVLRSLLVSGGIPVGSPHRKQKATSVGNSVAQCVQFMDNRMNERLSTYCNKKQKPVYQSG